jgi:hypothetical protein
MSHHQTSQALGMVGTSQSQSGPVKKAAGSQLANNRPQSPPLQTSPDKSSSTSSTGKGGSNQSFDDLARIAKQASDEVELQQMHSRLESAYPSTPYVRQTVSRDKIALMEGDDFKFTADLENGMVKVDVILKKVDAGAEVRPTILGRGRRMYDLAVSNFGKERIKGWKGELADDNAKAFQKAAAERGLSMQQAVQDPNIAKEILMRTPSGRIWQDHFDASRWSVRKIGLNQWGAVEFEVGFN